jgi:hypothetical protein
MLLKREAWDKIGYRADFPPHHFYDRLISTQMLEAGYEIATIGVECDHISGQTVNQEKGYQKMAHDWLDLHWDLESVFDDNHNYDSDIYKLAEATWLDEYRTQKHLIPIKV